MSRVALLLARFCLSAWVGAAALFVVNGVRQAIHPPFDSFIKNNLALLRFRPYYLFGFVLVGAALGGLLTIRRSNLLSSSRWNWTLCLIVASLTVMTVDYVVVYLPLEQMITPPTNARPAEFVDYHEASKYINGVHVGLACVAALLVSVPLREVAREPAADTPERV